MVLKFQRCLKFQVCFNEVSKMLQGSLKVFKESLKDVYRKFNHIQGCHDVPPVILKRCATSPSLFPMIATIFTHQQFFSGDCLNKIQIICYQLHRRDKIGNVYIESIASTSLNYYYTVVEEGPTNHLYKNSFDPYRPSLVFLGGVVHFQYFQSKKTGWV